MEVTIPERARRPADPRGTDLPLALARPLERLDLASSVLDAVGRVNPRALQPVASPDAGAAFQPRVLLAILTYCYARGIYASEDVEAFLREDELFRLLCGNEFPDERTLRRFRRHNREALQASLEATCARVLAHPPDRVTGGDGASSAGERLPINDRTVDPRQIAEHAAQRIEQAILMDSMAGD